MSSLTVECSICHEPLPAGEPVAFMDKQQVIHVRCYRPAPPPKMPRSRGFRGPIRTRSTGIREGLSP